MLQDKFKRNGGVYKCQTFGTLQSIRSFQKKMSDGRNS